MPGKRGPTVINQLLTESKDTALNAVQTFNNPLVTFKSEAFIVLMVIAWTRLLHAYYRQQKVEYRHYKMVGSRRKFARTPRGTFRYWDLESCLHDGLCPLDSAAKQNLRFLIGLRHAIQHNQSPNTDLKFAARHLACCLNYEEYRCQLFGER